MEEEMAEKSIICRLTKVCQLISASLYMPYHFFMFCVYISEIIIYPLRSSFVDGDLEETFDNNEEYRNLTFAQMYINTAAFCVVTLITLLSTCSGYRRFALEWKSVVFLMFWMLMAFMCLCNFVAAGTVESQYYVVQMFINVFGYGAIGIYWSLKIVGENEESPLLNYQVEEPGGQVLQPRVRIVAARFYLVNFLLGAIFVLDIFFTNIVDEVQKDIQIWVYASSILENVLLFESLHLSMEYVHRFAIYDRIQLQLPT